MRILGVIVMAFICVTGLVFIFMESIMFVVNKCNGENIEFVEPAQLDFTRPTVVLCDRVRPLMELEKQITLYRSHRYKMHYTNMHEGWYYIVFTKEIK